MAGVEKKKKSIFSQEHYWIGVVAGVVLASVIGYFMKNKKK
jgi:hypothetical protein